LMKVVQNWSEMSKNIELSNGFLRKSFRAYEFRGPEYLSKNIILQNFGQFLRITIMIAIRDFKNSHTDEFFRLNFETFERLVFITDSYLFLN